MSNSGLRQFDQTIQETNTWLNEISEDLGHPDRHMAYHALRGTLFALRDRLPVSECCNFASQLPMLIRGIFFEGYRPIGKPIKYGRDEFLEHVAQELQQAGGANAEEAIHSVIRVLLRHVSEGEMKQVHDVLPADLQKLWPGVPA